VPVLNSEAARLRGLISRVRISSVHSKRFPYNNFQLEQENHQLELELQQKVNSTDTANERVMEILDKLDAASIVENLFSLYFSNSLNRSFKHGTICHMKI